MAEFMFSDAEIEAARQAGAGQMAESPTPLSARYEPASGRVVVEFSNGSAVLVPARSLEDLEEATDEELADVTLLGSTGLHWEKLDVDFSIAGLMKGIFGTARFKNEIQSKGGRSKSAAKVAASRANGKLGGRPRKSA